jgi:hypothetical protein
MASIESVQSEAKQLLKVEPISGMHLLKVSRIQSSVSTQSQI